MRSWMFSLALCCGLTCLTVAAVSAQDEPKETETKPAEQKASELKTLKERASYGIGRNLAAQIKFDERLDLDPELVIRGFQDMLRDKESLMTDQELQETMLALQQKIREEALMRQKETSDNNKKAGEEFLAKNKERKGVVVLESGLQYEVLKKGTGKQKPKIDDTVKTHYHGTLPDGTVFDSSVDRGEPISFPVNGVIAGWTEALQLMTVGDKWKLYVPGNLAYGERGAGTKIGPNQVLVFEVELLDIE